MKSAGQLHLLKLCVGAECVEDLTAWQASRAAKSGSTNPVHVTRMWPRRADELLNGGSLYWVFKGLVLARQPVVALEPRQGEDGITRCAIVLDPNVVLTEAQPRRPFQGWRYLKTQDAPRDLDCHTEGTIALPPTLQAALSELGVR
jgi:hypothetical protein